MPAILSRRKKMYALVHVQSTRTQNFEKKKSLIILKYVLKFVIYIRIFQKKNQNTYLAHEDKN